MLKWGLVVGFVVIVAIVLVARKYLAPLLDPLV